MKTKRHRVGSVAGVLALSAGLAYGQSSLDITSITYTVSGHIQIEAAAAPDERCTLESTEDLKSAFTNVPDNRQVAADSGSMAFTVASGAASEAFYRMRRPELITWSDLESGFAGTFAIPLAEEGDYRFGYSSGVHAQLTNGNLLVVGHPYYNRQAEVQVPAALDGSEGTRVGNWIDITQGLLPDGWAGGPAYYLGGLLEVGARIHFTKHQWYNGSGTDWQTQGYYEGGYDGSGTASGMWTVSNLYAHHSRVGGYMSYPPQALREDGYAYVAGLEGMSGAALGRWGPNLFAIDPAVSNGAVRAATVTCHDSEANQAPDVAASNATSTWWVANSPTNQQWWIANKATDVEWIETDTHHGIIYFIYRGLGDTWYGASDAGPGLPDPYVEGYGYHAEGWALQVWIYDPDEVMEVYRDERDPWSLVPVEAVLLTERLPGAATETYYSFFTGKARTDLKMSLRNNRLIILQEDGYPANEWENTPKGYVINVP